MNIEASPLALNARGPFIRIEASPIRKRLIVSKIDREGRRIGKPRKVKPGSTLRLGPDSIRILPQIGAFGVVDMQFNGEHTQAKISGDTQPITRDLDDSVLKYAELGVGQTVVFKRLPLKPPGSRKVFGLAVTRVS